MSGFHVIGSKAALAWAERLGVRRPIENLVEDGILAGRVSGQGAARHVTVDGGLIATVLRLPERTAGGRRKLLIQRLESARANRDQEGRRRR